MTTKKLTTVTSQQMLVCNSCGEVLTDDACMYCEKKFKEGAKIICEKWTHYHPECEEEDGKEEGKT